MTVINNRYGFTIVFDAKYSNPNGDPDANNMPRMDLETGRGYVTDVCLKRKIRNYIEDNYSDKEGYSIYHRMDSVLNCQDVKAFSDAGFIPSTTASDKVSEAIKDKGNIKALSVLANYYYDVRAFGAVVTSLSKNKGPSNLQGPVQFGFAESVDPISPVELSITHCCVASEKQNETKGSHTIGAKWIVPYALYRVNGTISPMMAKKNMGENGEGAFTEKDVKILFEAISNMFENDSSASRGEMNVRAIYIYKHNTPKGNCKDYKLSDRLIIKRKDNVSVARCYDDYDVSYDYEGLNGVEVIEYPV